MRGSIRVPIGRVPECPPGNSDHAPGSPGPELAEGRGAFS